jgi:hypothetical protein
MPSTRKRRTPSARDLTIDPTIKGFMARNGIGRTKTYAEIAAGRLKVRKCGRRTIILPADEVAWRQSLPEGVSA